MRFENVFGSKTFEAYVAEAAMDRSLRSFAYPGALEDRWVKGTSVRLEPHGEEPWLGHFLAGRESPNAISLCCDHPDNQHIVVVSQGAGYLASPHDPKDWREIPLRPIMGHCAAATAGVLVLFDYTGLTGLSRDGGTWRTPSLSWDGLRNVRATQDRIIGEGWDAASSRFVGFEVDARTGASAGGVAPPGV